MNKLYVLQYDGGGYCAPFSGEIFTSRDKAYKYIKNNDNDMESFRYVSLYEYDNNMKGYKEVTHLYFIDKSDYPKNAINIRGYL